MNVDDLCFRARALAQTHPLTPAAFRYRQECFQRERRNQPNVEAADWAATAFVVGYCLRRSEEQLAALEPGEARCDPTPLGDAAPADHFSGKTARAQLAAAAERVSGQLRLGDPEAVCLLESAVVVDALDKLVASELDKRVEHVREQLTADEWDELASYITWWLVHGYSVRTTETC